MTTKSETLAPATSTTKITGSQTKPAGKIEHKLRPEGKVQCSSGVCLVAWKPRAVK